MLGALTGKLRGFVYFTVYAIEIAGFGRQQVYTLGKSQASRFNRAK
jgi:hypothetical protein